MSTMTVDCHVHIFGSSRDAAEPRHPHPEEAAALADVQPLGAAFGIRRFVLTQPSFLGFDNSHLLAAVARRPSDLRGVVWLPPSTDPNSLPGLAASGVAGLRFPLKYAREMPDWAAYADLLAAAGRHGLHIELGVSGPELVTALDRVLTVGATAVVDHLGLFDPTLGPDDDPAFSALIEAAETRHVWVKLSAPYRTAEALADRAAEQLLDRLGADRLVWGSDWPHVGPRLDRLTTYPAAMDWFRRCVPDEALRQQILAASPAALYGFPQEQPANIPS